MIFDVPSEPAAMRIPGYRAARCLAASDKDRWPRERRWRDGTHGALPRLRHHQALKTFEELKLWKDMIFVEVPKHRHFVCSQCGGRESGALMSQEGLAVTPYPAPVRCGVRGNILQKTRS